MSASDRPQVSVVLPTFRRTSLARTMAGLAGQVTQLTYEVVVVDNDPAGSAEPVVAAHADSIDATVRHLVEHTSGSAYARNRGIAEATAPITAFIDDDVVPMPDWLDVLVRPIIDGNADGSGGRVVLDPDVPRPRWFSEEGIGGYLTAFHLSDEPRELIEREYVVTANAAFRTDLLRRSGGFDPALGPRGKVQIVGDDVHVVRNVQRLGGRVVYLPDAVVVHELPTQRLRRGWLLKRAWWQGRSDWVLNADVLRSRRYGGAAVALDWYADQLRRRRREGLAHSPVLFHALCDSARTAGSLLGAARLTRVVDRGLEQPADTVCGQEKGGAAGGDAGDHHGP